MQAAQVLSQTLEAYAEQAGGSAKIKLKDIKANSMKLGGLLAEAGPGGTSAIKVEKVDVEGEFTIENMTSSTTKK
ncbi:hypothetical protein CSA56_11540 [candidate division KSB3 bacterium]|uniref:Uncharacterized protein n=1 Tax=candidate division KSB3 bacterium TaxID=2044937 RepID=A0A2G6KCM6_9BACT|nr:MAG: hypothetical protein CSA56_11540 [candidate division KSB3 bacterium]